MYNNDLLIKYMVESFDRNQPTYVSKESGPFITISREIGCQANLLAKMLRDELKKRGRKWSILNKEIIMESAKKLDMEPRKVQTVSESVDRTMMDEVLAALSTKYYKSDRKVRQTIANVIISAAHAGNAIIVGRGGVAITQGMQPSIHIKLYAPLEWRLQSLMDRFHANREHMLKEITKIDHRRHRLIVNALKGAEDNTFLYDLQINSSTVTHKEIVSLVMGLIEERFKK